MKPQEKHLLLQKSISIIIPFVNEKEEVLSTIESIAQYSSHIDYEIILINDASDDDYNYKEILSCRSSNVRYYENEHRIGVAACRDMGIALSNYEVFLLLDAHMRFYEKDTLPKFLGALSVEKNIILCCHTTAIGNTPHEKTPFGAYIEFWGDKGGLYPIWNTKDSIPNDSIAPVPCILGAAYAAHKEYWNYLRGLEGLVSYGSDEAYISLKYWMSGGKCLILKNLIVGHLYRKDAPYPFMGIDFIYNKLWISLLILPDIVSLRVLNNLQEAFSVQFNWALCTFYKNITNFIALKQYYKKILIEPFDDFYNFNSQCKFFSDSLKETVSDVQIDQVFSELTSKEYQIQDYGLFHGKMGIAIFLYLYNRQVCNNSSIEELAEKYLDEAIAYIEKLENIELSFEQGILGIAWGLSFLVKENIISGNINEILSDFDDIIFNYFDARFVDWSFNTGIIGLTYYSLMRMQQDQSILKKFPVFFILLTKVIKQKYIYEFANLEETKFPTIALLYLCFVEHMYNIISDFTSFKSLKLLYIIQNQKEKSFMDFILIKGIDSLLSNPQK